MYKQSKQSKQPRKLFDVNDLREMQYVQTTSKQLCGMYKQPRTARCESQAGDQRAADFDETGKPSARRLFVHSA